MPRSPAESSVGLGSPFVLQITPRGSGAYPKSPIPGIVGRRRLAALFAIVLGSLFTFVFLGTNYNRAPRIPDYREPAPLGSIYSDYGDPDASDEDSLDSQQTLRGPRISMIFIWDSNNDAAAEKNFPNFVQSFRANSPIVELVWIGVRRDVTDQCYDPTAYTGIEGAHPNVRFVCLTREEYYNIHVEYFCAEDRWACTPEQAGQVLFTMLTRHDSDWYKSAFRIFRGYIFERHMAPGVEWWGWVDHDTILGNFETQFPWEMSGYDVLIPSFPEDSLLYLRGYLAFFRTDPEVEFKLSQYPNLMTPLAYLEHHTTTGHPALEETEYSAYIIRRPDITFLCLPSSLAHVPSHLFSPHALKFATLGGVYRTHNLLSTDHPPIHQLPVLALPDLSAPRASKRMFSEKGISRPVEIHEGSYQYGLWFPLRYATHYNHYNPIPEGYQRIVGRGGGYWGGEQGVWERLEPPRPGVVVRAVHDPEVKVTLDEGLYLHWFEEKSNTEWFANLPPTALQPGQALVSAEKFGAEIWDMKSGEVVWNGGLQ